MAWLFVGMIATGIIGRVTLLSVRGGWFQDQQAKKSIVRNLLDVALVILALAAFVIGFWMFDWWVPLLAVILGYMLIPVILVTSNTFALFHSAQLITQLVALICFTILIGLHLEAVG